MGVLVMLAPQVHGEPERHVPQHAGVNNPIVVTQLPAGSNSERQGSVGQGMLRAPFGDGARIIAVYPDGAIRVLTAGFHSACDPDISFDGTRMLFAGKVKASDNWNIYEAANDGSAVRQITSGVGNCRSPGYQATLYTIVSAEPWYQITFVGDAAGTMNEDGSTPATHLYSCKLDGSAVRRLTYNLSSDLDPFLMEDGRLLFSSWQRRTLGRGTLGRVSLFGVNIDGADLALFASQAGRRVKHMPCVTGDGLVVFVESDRVPWDGAGRLSCVTVRRPLHSYRPITREADGLFHSPSPLADGTILVSRRPFGSKDTHAVCRLDPQSGRWITVFDDPQAHDIQAKLLCKRSQADGRSSVVMEQDLQGNKYPHGKLYCLNVHLSDLEKREWMPPGTVRRLRVLEGVPLKTEVADAYLPPLESLPGRRAGSSVNGIPPLAQRRLLGEIDVSEDGSFNITVPANTPIELQTLDRDGFALRSCGWIWAKNREPRGCIGCHEDGELTPDNLLVDSVSRRSIRLTLPPSRRRTVDFRRDVMPIIERKCVACHGPDGAEPGLDGGLKLVIHENGKGYFNRAYEGLLAADASSSQSVFSAKYVHPGRARTSPLIWHIFGRNTSRPWDGDASRRPVKKIPLDKAEPLTDDQRRTFVEWVDMGAMWDGIPSTDDDSPAPAEP
jgi:hypothetical protein